MHWGIGIMDGPDRTGAPSALAILAGRTLLLNGASLTETAWTRPVVTTANFSASAGIFAWMLVWSLRSRAPSRSEDRAEEHAG